jgi:hypothetical protein
VASVLVSQASTITHELHRALEAASRHLYAITRDVDINNRDWAPAPPGDPRVAALLADVRAATDAIATPAATRRRAEQALGVPADPRVPARTAARTTESMPTTLQGIAASTARW